MLQTLLEDRFQLKVHRESREASVLALVVVKGGHKLTPTKKPDAKPFVAILRPGSIDQPAITVILEGTERARLAVDHRAGAPLQTPRPGSDWPQRELWFSGGIRGGGRHGKLENAKGQAEVLVVARVEKLGR
jgi:hypothetical protein